MITTQIRCHNCKMWNHFDETHLMCVGCNAELRPVTEAEIASLERRKTSGELKVTIYESDSKVKRFVKNIYNLVILVYMSIIAFFLWIFVAGPG